MARAGAGTQNRLSAILLNVGTPVARTLFEKRVKDLTPEGHDSNPWTVDEFLKENKPKIRAMNRNKPLQILPDSLQAVKLEKWDLSLLCRILLECCELQPDIKHFIQHLLKLRNKLSHMSELSADETKYSNYLSKLKAIICSCLKEINDELFSEKINKMVMDFEQGYFTGEVMEQLKSMHVETTETFSEFKQNQQLMFTKFEELLQKMNVIETRLDPSDKIQIPESGVEIYVKNCTTDKENEISNRLVQYFEECIKEETDFSEISTSCQQKIKEAVQRAYKLFLSNRYKPTKTENRCIFIRFQFTSLKSMIAFFREYMSGELQERLLDLQASIRMETECEDATLEVIMDTEEILATFNKIVASFSEILLSWNTAASKGTLYNEKYAEARIRGVHLVPRTTDDSNEITSGLRVSFENYSDEHKQHLKESFNNGEIDSAMQNIQDAVADEFKTTKIRITAHLIDDTTSQGNSAERRQSSVGKRVEKRMSHDTNTPKSHHFILYAWLCFGILAIFISRIICHRAEIMMWVHKGEYTKGFYKSASTETKEVSLDRDQRGIATVEIYRAQRKIAHYFELSYLLVADYPEQAKAIRLMANSARTQHLMTSGLMKKYAVTSAHIVNTMLPLLSDAVCELKSERVVVDIFDRIIKIAEEMKTETESVLQRYVDIQTEVQNNVASVLSKSDKIVAEHTRTSADSVRDLQHLKVTAKETNEETKISYDSIVIQETGMFGRMTSDEKTLFDSVLSPSDTLCGRQENPAMDKLIADGNVFTGLFHSHNRRQNALLLYGELYQEEDEIARMHEEHDKELDRFTLLKTNKIESDRENLNTLREANAHLRHTDEQFTRIIEYWSNIATALKFVRDESESGGVYLDEIGNPAFSERFKASIDRAQKRWKVFGRICSDYVQESGMEINKLYNFLSAPIDSMATSARTRRQEELFITIEADIENTYPK